MRFSEDTPDIVHCTHQELFELLRKKRAQPVSLVTRTPVRIRAVAKKILEKGVWRTAFRLGWIAVAYEKLVNNARGREGNPVDAHDVVQPFKAGPLWRGAGNHIAGHACIVMHETLKRVYLKFWLQRVAQSVFEDGEGAFLAPHVVIPHVLDESGCSGDPKAIALYEQSAKQSRAERRVQGAKSLRHARQGLKKPITWQTIQLEHVTAIRMGGVQYLVDDPQEKEKKDIYENRNDGPQCAGAVREQSTSKRPGRRSSRKVD